VKPAEAKPPDVKPPHDEASSALGTALGYLKQMPGKIREGATDALETAEAAADGLATAAKSGAVEAAERVANPNRQEHEMQAAVVDNLNARGKETAEGTAHRLTGVASTYADLVYYGIHNDEPGAHDKLKAAAEGLSFRAQLENGEATVRGAAGTAERAIKADGDILASLPHLDQPEARATVAGAYTDLALDVPQLVLMADGAPSVAEGVTGALGATAEAETAGALAEATGEGNIAPPQPRDVPPELPQTVDVKPPDAVPADTEPADAEPAEANPADAKLAEGGDAIPDRRTIDAANAKLEAAFAEADKAVSDVLRDGPTVRPESLGTIGTTQSRSYFRVLVKKIMKAGGPDHPFAGAMVDGKMLNSTAKGVREEHWSEDARYLEAGHGNSGFALSKGPGGEPGGLRLQTAYANRFQQATIEIKGAISQNNVALNIGGLPVDVMAARDLAAAGRISPDAIRNATIIRYGF